MAKKDNHVITTAPEQTEVQQTQPPVEEPVLYESEAYGTPQQDAGATTTVTKPVGVGGPVPIVAPKHNTIQLQPIIVPLAVVPYMTQDSDILRTDGSGTAAQSDISSAVEFDRAEQAAARSKSRAALQNRMFSLVMFLLSALMIAAFLTAYYKPEIHAEYSLYQVDVIGQIKFWVEVGEPLDLFLAIVNIAAAAFAAVGFVVSLLGLITGRYARKTFMALTFLSAAAYAAEIIYEVVKKVFDAAWDADILTLLALSGLAFLLSVVFAAVCVRREDREETVLHSHSEI